MMQNSSVLIVNGRLVGIVHASADKTGEIKDNPFKLEEAYNLGKEMICKR